MTTEQETIKLTAVYLYSGLLVILAACMFEFTLIDEPFSLPDLLGFHIAMIMAGSGMGLFAVSHLTKTFLPEPDDRSGITESISKTSAWLMMVFFIPIFFYSYEPSSHAAPWIKMHFHYVQLVCIVVCELFALGGVPELMKANKQRIKMSNTKKEQAGMVQ